MMLSLSNGEPLWRAIYDVLTAAEEETLRILIEELPVSASFSAPEITAISGQQVEIPVTVSGKFEAHTLEMHIGYDGTKFTRQRSRSRCNSRKTLP